MRNMELRVPVGSIDFNFNFFIEPFILRHSISSQDPYGGNQKNRPKMQCSGCVTQMCFFFRSIFALKKETEQTIIMAPYKAGCCGK